MDGDHGPGMKIFYCDHFVLPLPADHRFPMEKYALLRERVLHSPLFSAKNLHVPEAATDEQLALAHDVAYVQRVCRGDLSEQEIRRLGFPWSPDLVERSRRSVGATIAASRAAIEDGAAASLSGGTHHAFRDAAEGYCVFNDSAVAVRVMQREQRIRRAIIIDADVHQGNGTAAIFADDPSVFTFSIHGANNFPLLKTISDLDVALEDETGDERFLEALDSGLSDAMNRAEPEFAVYLAGADPFKADRLGKLALSKAGLAERDRLVFRHCAAAGVRVAVTMAGGYAADIADTVDIHFQTIVAADELAARWRGCIRTC
jgi:acetoin utilization deacetylase AcuC-like enzyme